MGRREQGAERSALPAPEQLAPRARAARTIAVVAASAGSLACEILLVRLFGIEHFHHFATMAIGVAMLGWAAAGTMLALARRPPGPATPVWAALATGVALALAPVLTHALPFDPTQLAWDLRQWGWLALVELTLSLPFAAAAVTVLSGLALEPQRPGRLYGASFLGAGLGVAAALGALAVLEPVRAVCAAAVLTAAGAVAAALLARSPTLQGWAWVALAATLAMLARPPWSLELVPYKSLPQVEAYPGARRVAERHHPVGWMVAVEAPAFHHAPGLSLSYQGELPRQVALFVDGQLAGAVPAGIGSDSAAAWLDALPGALPYVLGLQRRVLVVGAGGSTEVEMALAHGAREVTALELHGAIADYARRAGPRARWVVGDARGHLARTRARWDLVALGPEGGPGAAAAGVHALNEDYLHTVDAYVEYLRHLAPGGVLAITRWLTVPARSPVRLILTTGEALRRTGVRDPGAALVVAHSWGTVTVLAKPSGFTPGELRALRSWAGERRFDLDWASGPRPPGSPWNEIGEPELERAARAAAEAGTARRFAAAYPFRVEPVSDARPYPHHFIGWRALPRLLGGDRGSWLPFAEWGTLTLAATVAQAVVLGAALLLLPLAGRHATRSSEPRLDRASRGALPAFFGAIGFAYLAAELAAIQQLGLLLGHPVYAVAAALAAFLVFSGIGSLVSERIRHQRTSALLAILAGMLALEALALLPVVHALEPAPLGLRAAVALLALAPPALLMGLPFPVGLRVLGAGHARGLAWAWAVNGVASVIAAPLAALIALETGTRVLFALAAFGYLAAAVVVARYRRAEGR
jgi:hypothetical protein